MRSYKSLLRTWRSEIHKKRAGSFTKACVLAASTAVVAGCASSPDVWTKTVRNDTSEIDQISARVDTPTPEIYPTSYSAEPITAEMLSSSDFDRYQDLSLDDVVRLAMQNSTVMRDLGGVVLRSPDSVRTRFTPGLIETDPRFSMEAALSAFDAQFTASAMYNSNDRLYNNALFAGGTSTFVQDLHEYNIGVDKRTATGALLSLRSRTLYDANNAPANNFPSYYESLIEGEVRQPLLQGAGIEFNRIAGPGSTPGLYNGVLIAKTNSDISNHDFRIALRDYLSNVENAYWDLYYSYRELDARKKAMEQSLKIWNMKKAESGAGLEAKPDESLARQQYFEFKADVDEAISGRLLQGTQTRNGSQGGTLQGMGGVLSAERRLRLLIGLPASDGSLLRTAEEPPTAKVVYDWGTISQEALSQRTELRRQQLVTKKREMELLAAQNFLNPRLDAVARYRYRGLGDDFIANGGNGGDRPASSFGNLLTGEHQEYTLGVELEVPLGYRQGHAAVANAEFAVAHARAIFKEQQREVINNLNAAIADASRAHLAIENNLNQYLAARDYLAALETRAKNLNDPVDLILDAQTRLVEAEVRLFRARAEYAVALKNIQFEKGTLLNYSNLLLVNDEVPEAPIEEPGRIEPVPAATEVEAAAMNSFDNEELAEIRGDVQNQQASVSEVDDFASGLESGSATQVESREDVQRRIDRIQAGTDWGKLEESAASEKTDREVSSADEDVDWLVQAEAELGALNFPMDENAADSEEVIADEIISASEDIRKQVTTQVAEETTQEVAPAKKRSVFSKLKTWK